MLASLPKFYTLHVFETLESTMDEAKCSIQRDEAQPGDLIWAKNQTMGRGRQGREWVSKKGNFFLSLILEGQKNPFENVQLSFVTALSVANALKKYSWKNPIHLKWPNDLLLGTRKAGGILLEVYSNPKKVSTKEWVIIGIGINITTHPLQTLFPATHLSQEIVGEKISTFSLLVDWAREFLKVYGVFTSQGFQNIRQAWLEFGAQRGDHIRVRSKNLPPLEGTFWDMTLTGALIVKDVLGKQHIVTAGDIF